ncbi:MAG: hypothetical protein Q7R77_02120 [Candidatus Daviesbacteria bacterium]|nr:hypothetical protein [Candidatus Daviesbacteria bacterium]
MKISINLLPPEDIALAIQRAKFYKIQLIGIIIILTMIFLTSLTVALRILQGRSMAPVQTKVVAAEQRVSDLKSTQGYLMLLKDRLKVIDQYLGVSSKQSLVYQLMDKLIPPSVIINAISINQAGVVTFVAIVPDSISLDNLLSNLTDQESNDGQIREVSVESLNRGRDGFYRISFKIKSEIL